MAHQSSISVSVVLCTYNGALFLAEQIESILQQTRAADEIVIADDCSTDNTAEIVKAFASKYPIIKWHRNEANLGYNKNFEKALALATGNVLAIADQDDIWHPQKIALLLAHWPQSSLLIYSDSVPFLGHQPQKPRTSPFMNKLQGTDPRTLAFYNTISGHAMLIRRELLLLALPFNPHVFYDWWLAVVAMSNGGVTYLPQVLVYQRMHTANHSMTPPEAKATTLLRERLHFKRNLEQFLKTPNMEADHQRFFEALYALWAAAVEGEKRWALFRFLLRHRKIIYSSKKNSFRFLSHLKRSLRYAFGSTKGV
jgi:glycosyltransferase involved in cell wall biosynthesis